MAFLYSLFFAAGVAAFIYTKAGRRLGYSDGKSVWTIVAVVFILTAIIFWTVLSTLGIH